MEGNGLQSAVVGEIIKALVAVQGELKPASRSAVNPAFKNHYATLSDTWAACRDALQRHHLAVVQAGEAGDDGGITVVTTLYHISGQWLASRVRMPLEKGTAQAVGSAIAYARRYGLAALVGVVSDDDDDGNAASGRGQRAPRKAASPAPSNGSSKAKIPIGQRSVAQLRRLREWAATEGKDDLTVKIDEELERRRLAAEEGA